MTGVRKGEPPPSRGTRPSRNEPPRPDREAGSRRASLSVPVGVAAIAATAAVVTVAAVMIVGTTLVDRQEQDRGLEALAAVRVDPATIPHTVPIDVVAGHISTEATLGPSAELVVLILDTGAPVVLSTALAERHGAAAGIVETMSVDGRVADSDVVSVPRLDIGTVAFLDVGAVAGSISPGDPLACISPHGLIGANLMQGAVWQIDYGGGTATIAPSVETLEHVDGAIAVPFERAGEASGSPVIELPAGEGTLRFLVDTGSDGWLSVNPVDLEGTGTSVPDDAPAISTIAAGVAGRFETRLAWTTLDLSLGDTRLEAVPIATSEAIPAGRGNLGNAFLRHYVVTIDWLDDMLYLDPASADPRPDTPMSATLGWDGDGFVIGSIVEGAPGTEVLATGAAVSAIDGIDVGGATFDDFCARWLARPAAPFEVALEGEAPVGVALEGEAPTGVAMEGVAPSSASVVRVVPVEWFHGVPDA